MTSCLPSVMATPMRKSPSSSSAAMMPLPRGLANAESGVFFTVPWAVAMKMKCPSSNCFTGRMAVIFSPSSNGNILTTGLPRLLLEPCGTW